MTNFLRISAPIVILLLCASCSKEPKEPVLWDQFTRENFNERYVNSIAVDSKNNKWFATFGGLLKYDNNQWTVYNKLTGAPCDTLFGMTIDSKDKIYCITSRKNIVCFDGNQWSTIGEGKIYNPTAICTDLNDKLWIAGLSGLYRYDGTILSRFYGPTYTNSNYWAMDMAVDANNHVWITAEDSGLVKFDGVKWINYSIKESKTNWGYKCLGIDNTGNIWIGGNATGAWKYNGVGFEQFKKDTVPSLYNTTHCMAFDSKGNAWFGTDKGVLKYHGKIWTTFLDREIDPDPMHYAPVKSLVIDKNDEVWTTAFGQVYKIFNR